MEAHLLLISLGTVSVQSLETTTKIEKEAVGEIAKTILFTVFGILALLFVVGLIAATIYCIYRRKKAAKEISSNQSKVEKKVSKSDPELEPTIKRSPTYWNYLNSTPPSEPSLPTEWIEPFLSLIFRFSCSPTLEILLIYSNRTLATLHSSLFLVKTIFTNYNKNVRPDTTTAINLLVALRFFTLQSVDQQQEAMSFSGDFEMTWNDPALVWDPSQYGGQTVVIAPETDVWRPDVTVYNSVSQTDIIPEAQRLVSISSNGNVMKSSPSVYSTRCQMQINHFPFDTQTCQIRLSSWVYDMTELTIDAPSWLFNYSKPTYTGNSEWDILDLKVLDVTTNDTDGSKFSELEYLVTLKRHSTYYICVIFIPTFIVTTLSLIGFFIPFDNCGNRLERITLGLTTLLSLAVMLNIVGSDMPKSSNLPQLGGFVLAECLICGVAMLITIALLFGHQRITTRRILPGIKGVNKIGTKKGWMGMRALREVDSSRSIDEMKKTAEDVVFYLRTLEAREELRLYWLKIFDKIDLFFLVLFQIVNIIVMLCYLLIR